MLRSLHLMLGFYGMHLHQGIMRRNTQFSKRCQVWLTPNNHNFLRLTRILNSLKLVGLVQEQKALFQDIRMQEGRHVISNITFSHWKRSTQMPFSFFIIRILIN